jgi:hypothetical protein
MAIKMSVSAILEDLMLYIADPWGGFRDGSIQMAHRFFQPLYLIALTCLKEKVSRDCA